MNTKLTLVIDEQVVAGAKGYANQHRKSVSEIVESGLSMLVGVKPATRSRKSTHADITDIKVSPFIKNFHDGIRNISVPADLDYKKMFASIMAEKHA